MLSSDAASNWPVPTVHSPNIGAVRLAAGLLQGMVLYLLYQAVKDKAWPATEPLLSGPLLLVWLIVPVIFISSLGVLNRRQLIIWIPAAAAVLAALGVYDVWRAASLNAAPYAANNKSVHLSSQLIFVSTVGFFIAQSLIMAAAGEKRRIASYPAYFETAWKQFVQLAFSGLFVGVVWLVLLLGSELFMLIKLDFLRKLINESWFVIPVIAFAFSCAMHITDVRPAIVRGIRTLLLVLMSWILPVAVLVIGGFLLSLPFTGLEPLWDTRSATGVLLGAAALLIVLINAAFQDGAPDVAAARVVQGSVRLAALLLVPIVVIAMYALGLRVGDYGWTTSRILAAACLIVASLYASGYACAALRPARLGAISGTNIANAFVVLVMLLVLFSPLGDPARLSVANQMARLEAGKVPVDKFDFTYLRFEGERYGQAALEKLRASAQGKDAQTVRDRIAEVQKLKGRGPRPEDFMARPAPVRLSAKARVWPKGSQLPASFLQTDLNLLAGSPYPACLRGEQGDCDIVLVDLTADGNPEIVMLSALPDANAVVVGETKPGQWRALGTLPSSLAACGPLRKALLDGQYNLVPPAISELQVAGTRLAVRPRWEPEVFECKDEAR
ncbi:DUF4153 domain-containing protein [Massilia sp. RP-1-19]|uniref:DUF4153 domain-containing protein n=1 Tax=Massilia polaris TaxID=2728846 RepID=A0A848HSW0_9BURK|nr:DUF4153 domain-containing protein [Massilia polaris]NML63139.1 DUF4153 domain-containing protein [Massilia polaris]